MSCPRCCTAFIAVIALLASSSCSDAPVMPAVAGPTPGEIEVALTPSAVPAGAVLVTVRGVNIGAPTPLDGSYQIFVSPIGEEGAYTVAIVGERITGTLFRFAVPDITAGQAYFVTLVEVAGEDNRLQGDVSGYRLSIVGRAHAGSTGVTPN